MNVFEEYKSILLFIKIIIIFINVFIFLEIYFKNKAYVKLEKVLVLLFGLIYSVIFCIRPIIPYTDTAVYINKYVNHLNSFYNILENTKDVFFFIYSYFTKIIYNDETVYLFIIGLTYLAPLIIALKKIKHPFLVFSLFTLTISFENLGINIIRQGIGLSFFTLSIVLYFNNQKKSYVYFLLAILFHISLIIPVVIFLIFSRLKNIYFSTFILIICSVLSILNINVIGFIENIPIVSEIFKERNQNYSDVVSNYKVGFRPDFFIYNYIFILLGYYTYFKYKFKSIVDKNIFLVILNTFIVMSSVFFLMFTQSFSDRYGVLSWQLIPLLFLPYFLNPKSKLGIVNSATLFIFYSAISLFFILK